MKALDIHLTKEPCECCGKSQQDRAMIYRGERWCSDLCRKIILDVTQ